MTCKLRAGLLRPKIRNSIKRLAVTASFSITRKDTQQKAQRLGGKNHPNRFMDGKISSKDTRVENPAHEDQSKDHSSLYTSSEHLEK